MLEFGVDKIKYGFGHSLAPYGCYCSDSLGSLYVNRTDDKSVQRERIQQVLKEVIIDSFGVVPKDKDVVILFPDVITRWFLNTITEVLHEDLNVRGVCFVPQHYLPILATGNTTGFIIDVGVNRVLIVSIAFGIINTFLEGCTFIIRLSRRHFHSLRQIVYAGLSIQSLLPLYQ